MKFILKRSIKAADGIFGTLLDSSGAIVAYTLEHSYPSPAGSANFLPKVPAGFFECELGLHELAGMDHAFSTYEVTGVVGHSGILFHTGNRNGDSEGCILLGTSIVRGGSCRELGGSRIAFQNFLSICDGASSFTLEVRDI